MYLRIRKSIYFSMKKYLWLFLLFFVFGCANLERDIVDEFVQNSTQKLDFCQITGFDYAGIESQAVNDKVLKVLMVHGIGTHHPGYSMELQQNLAKKMGLDILSRVPKNITLKDPILKQKEIGNLRITFWKSSHNKAQMLFYELTWSEITQPYKNIIAFDTTEQYSEYRVPFNNAMKDFLDNILPDPMIYLVDPNNLILHSAQQALCWLAQTDWDNIPNGQSKVCPLKNVQLANRIAEQNVMFITHSLGSEILLDTIISIANDIESLPKKEQAKILPTLQHKKVTLFMLANQLPLLLIDKPLPRVHNKTAAYCQKTGKDYHLRIFDQLNIIAFSDPNDILSYEIPQTFANEYLDSRLCAKVTNVVVNVAPEISAFGVGIVNPDAAHTDYDKSQKVIDLMVGGALSLPKECPIIYLKDDDLLKR